MTDPSREDKSLPESFILIFNGDFERFVKEEQYKKGDYDFDLMKHLVDLAKSQSVQERLKCLKIIQSPSNDFPIGFVENLLIALKEDKDKQVRQKAIGVDSIRKAQAFEIIKKNLKDYGEIYGEIFKRDSKILNDTFAAFDRSRDIAKSLSQVFDKPIATIDPQKYFDFTKFVEAHRANLQQPTIDFGPSPISSIEHILEPIMRQDHPHSTIGEVLGKSDDEITAELKEISESDKDIVFNYEGYRLLYDLERFLRDLIEQRICVRHKKTIESKIPAKTLQRWRDRKSQEEDNPLMTTSYRLIDYSDFTDLKEIFQKGNNMKEFSDLLNDQQFRTLIAKLDELDPIRKKIAHSRPLSKDEFDRLRMYANDIAAILNRDTPETGDA